MLAVLVVNIDRIGATLLALLLLVLDLLHPGCALAAPESKAAKVTLQPPPFLRVVVHTNVTFEAFYAEVYALVFAFFLQGNFRRDAQSFLLRN